MSSKKSGFGSWTSFKDGLAEYKENELRKEWWYNVSDDSPYITRNERRRNKGIFFQPIKHVKTAAVSVKKPVVDPEPVATFFVEQPEPVVAPVIEPEQYVEPADPKPVEPVVEAEPVVELESETAVDPELVSVVESKTVEAKPFGLVETTVVSEVESNTVTEIKSEEIIDMVQEEVSATVGAEVQLEAEYEARSKLESEADLEIIAEMEAEVDLEDVAEVETKLFEAEVSNPEIEAELDAIVEAEFDTVKVELDTVMAGSDEKFPQDMLNTGSQIIENDITYETKSIIDQFDTKNKDETVPEVAPVFEMPVIVLDGSSENAPVAEPVTVLGALAATEAPMGIGAPISEELQVIEAELVTEAPLSEAASIAVKSESEEAVLKDEESIKDASLIQNMYAKTQPPPSYFDDMKTH